MSNSGVSNPASTLKNLKNHFTGPKIPLLIEMFSFLWFDNECRHKTPQALHIEWHLYMENTTTATFRRNNTEKPCVWPLIETYFSPFNLQYVALCIYNQKWEGLSIKALYCGCLRRLCFRYLLKSYRCTLVTIL